VREAHSGREVCPLLQSGMRKISSNPKDHLFNQNQLLAIEANGDSDSNGNDWRRSSPSG
jgi:hypothetical protein